MRSPRQFEPRNHRETAPIIRVLGVSPGVVEKEELSVPADWLRRFWLNSIAHNEDFNSENDTNAESHGDPVASRSHLTFKVDQRGDAER